MFFITLTAAPATAKPVTAWTMPPIDLPTDGGLLCDRLRLLVRFFLDFVFLFAILIHLPRFINSLFNSAFAAFRLFAYTVP